MSTIKARARPNGLGPTRDLCSLFSFSRALLRVPVPFLWFRSCLRFVIAALLYPRLGVLLPPPPFPPPRLFLFRSLPLVSHLEEFITQRSITVLSCPIAIPWIGIRIRVRSFAKRTSMHRERGRARTQHPTILLVRVLPKSNDANACEEGGSGKRQASRAKSGETQDNEGQRQSKRQRGQKRNSVGVKLSGGNA